MTHQIYLDANATTPVLPAAAASAQHVMGTLFGNPSSAHYAGLQAREMMATVRTRAARLLGAGSGQLLFVSGATEAIQTAVLSALCAVRARKARGEATGGLLLYGATEHKAVPESLAHWNHLLGLDLELRALPVNTHGQHDLHALRTLATDAAMVCTMAANNETGCVSDLPGIQEVLRQVAGSALWLVDCVQALGKLPLDLATLRIDYAAFSGHKLYAPKGIGLLYVRNEAPFTPLMAGGGQEGGQRSGTENMAGIAALGAVLEALEDGHTFRSHGELVLMRERLAHSLREALPGLVFNAPFDKALPTTLNFAVPGFSSKELLDLFDAAGIRVSAGSACSATKAEPSFVLEAMGLPAWQAASAVRMSFGPATDEDLIHQACTRISACGAALRASGLTRSNVHPPRDDGVVQFSADGQHTWLLVDAASSTCIVVDPLPALEQRLVSHIRSQDLRVRAVLGTGTAGAAAHARLLAHLDARIDTGRQHHLGSGWPIGCPATTTLDDGSLVETLPLGALSLARLPLPSGQAYLLGRIDGSHLGAGAVQFAFVGNLLAGTAAKDGSGSRATAPGAAACVPRLPQVVHPGTLLCSSNEQYGAVASTLQADASPVPATDRDDLDLCAGTLDAFLRQHADALLVDVREPFERLAGSAPTSAGRTMLHVPLSRLVNQLESWLQGARPPLVFVCRSGNRSGKAASCLRRLGYRQAWHLAGGLALAGSGAALPSPVSGPLR